MELDEALRELKRELEALYGDRLRGVYLFGSHARGEAGPDSDVDVAVVLDDY
ncbi:MAG: nucleotidyltransferase domain-containing protein, partial [Armatimonadota bacterium]